MIFDSKGKERFRQLLERHAEMAGIEVFTWCCMGNHFHLLVEVPNAEEGRAKLDDEEILRRIGLVCSKERAKGMRDQLMLLKEQSPEMGYLEYRERLLARMFDVSVFMKELKQAYTQWYNRRVKRKGPLWQDRYKSVLLENDEKVLLTMAAYIDLNPVRAGLVKDPKDYRWSGYGEAVVGNRLRRAGLMRVVGEMSGDGRKWRGVQAQYRRYLYGEGEEVSVEGAEENAAALLGNPGASVGKNKRGRGMRARAVAKVEREGGALGLSALLRVRVRYFTQSVAFGSREFVEEVFERNREKLQVKRERGAREPKERALRKASWSGLLDLRM